MQGQLELFQVSAPSLEGNPLGDPIVRTTPVYLPKGHGEAGRRFPVVYFLHPFTGSALAWLNAQPFSPSVPERIDRLIASQAVPPFIGVFVDGWTALGGSQWINSSAIGPYADYLARDVVDWADRTLPTIPEARARAVTGRSSGGYGALVMGRDFPQVFGHVAANAADACFEYCYLGDLPKAAAGLLKAGGPEAWFRDFVRRAAETKMRGDDHPVLNVLAMAAAYSPRPGAPLGLELPFEAETGRLRPEVWNRWLEADPVRFIPKHLDSFRQLRTLFLDCGNRDEFNLRWGARMMVEALRGGGVPVTHEEFDDGHMGTNYRYDRALSLLVPRMWQKEG